MNEKLLHRISTILIQSAKDQKTIEYGQLSKSLGGAVSPQGLNEPVSEISMRCIRSNRPPLSSIVLTQTTHLPSELFFTRIADEMGHPNLPGSQWVPFYEEQRDQVFAYEGWDDFLVELPKITKPKPERAAKQQTKTGTKTKAAKDETVDEMLQRGLTRKLYVKDRDTVYHLLTVKRFWETNEAGPFRYQVILLENHKIVDKVTLKHTTSKQLLNPSKKRVMQMLFEHNPNASLNDISMVHFRPDPANGEQWENEPLEGLKALYQTVFAQKDADGGAEDAGRAEGQDQVGQQEQTNQPEQSDPTPVQSAEAMSPNAAATESATDVTTTTVPVTEAVADTVAAGMNDVNDSVAVQKTADESHISAIISTPADVREAASDEGEAATTADTAEPERADESVISAIIAESAPTPVETAQAVSVTESATELPSAQDTPNIADVQEALTAPDQPAIDSTEITPAEKELLIKHRISQSSFKQQLMSVEANCKLCAIANEHLLVATHIKPWSESSDQERSDVDNGLLLCHNHYALFDQGRLAFADDGATIISPQLDEESLGYFIDDTSPRIKATEGQKAYLRWHRENKYTGE
ncbi:HNH endonuclease [Brevibacillus dissolubilis]|uniref:HNH endonuclease n=1 Tax=Brevibacillus dissolubilis TaxID=1844116 RepID=UPI001115BC3A|nr:HNH endonuclease signature motif containing protein [Brevibacillus dissolubilis]